MLQCTWISRTEPFGSSGSVIICLPQVKRVPGSSGRVHKNTEGEWVWSDDEMRDDANETAVEPVSAGVSCSFRCCF